MDDDRRMYWHNFVTGQMDYRTAPTTDDEAKQYIPQMPAALGLYEVRRLQDATVLDAMEAVLRAVVGK